MTDADGAIAMAVYRPDPELLRCQIESIRSQDAGDWRCVVGIDGPDRDTYQLLIRLVDGDHRFEIIEFEERLGFYRNFERVLMAAAELDVAWIALADQDDRWHDDKLSRLAGALATEPRMMGAVCQARLVDEAGNVLGVTRRHIGTASELLANNEVTGSFLVLRHDVLRVALPFPEPTDAAYHDHWLGLCALILGGVLVVDDELQDYVQHGHNVVGEEVTTTAVSALSRIPAAKNPLGIMRYLAAHRWGWRVNMLQAVSARIPAEALAGAGIHLGAEGHISRRSAIRMLYPALRGQSVPTRRGTALLFSALIWGDVPPRKAL